MLKQISDIIDVNMPKSKKATTTLLLDFRITTKDNIRELQEFVALNYPGHKHLYRGLESSAYTLDSSIVREVKMKNNECTVQDIIAAEKLAFKLFTERVFKDEWLENKPKNVDPDFFKMSIGRHLGLSCRLIDVTASLETAVWFAVNNSDFHKVDGYISVFILDISEEENDKISSFNGPQQLMYAHEPFLTNAFEDLPLGERRRLVQNGHFIWVNNESLLEEQKTIFSTTCHLSIIIPKEAKASLAKELNRDVYCGSNFKS